MAYKPGPLVETPWPSAFEKEPALASTTQLTDAFGRQFPYLRLSLTDACNFRCTYCLPDGYRAAKKDTFLSKPEIIRIVRGFVGLGVWKIRLTGGEPTIRTDFIEIAEEISAMKGLKKLAFTTNGYKLGERAESYFNAGLRHINVSIDSLESDRFRRITGHDRLGEILDGIAECQRLGFETIKVNAVLLKDLNHDELEKYIDFVKSRNISVRFIELMRTGENKDYFDMHHLSGAYVSDFLMSKGWQVAPRVVGAGPAIEFIHPSSIGSIGLIAPYSKDFCKSCNRLRVSAKGNLHLCLFGEFGYSLRSYLQDDGQIDELQEKILSLMKYKRDTHYLHQGETGMTEHLASIGG